MALNHSAPQVFGGLNCDGGFVSFYREYFAEAEKVYILKGGPGTGKSKLMKEFAAKAMRSGEDPLLILCGSDPASLDGVYLPKRRIGILDGTAPHTLDPHIPGVDGDIVDLGRFWDADSLSERSEEICALCGKKKRLYDTVYRDFRMMALLWEEREKLLLPLPEEEKMRGVIRRLLPRSDGGNGSIRTRQYRSVGMKGNVVLPLPNARSEVRICGQFESGLIFMRYALEEAEKRGLAVEVSYHPVLSEVPEVLFFPESGLLLSAIEKDGSEKTIRMQRFLDRGGQKEHRIALRQNAKLWDCFFSSALSHFEEIASVHFALEKMYGEAMDFVKKEEFEQAFLSGLFGTGT